MFRKHGLPQTAAQELVDFYIAKTQEAHEAPFKAMVAMREAWRTEVKSDPAIGPRLDAVRTTISKAIDTLGPDLAPAFRQAMDLTGAGDNPAFIRAFAKFAERLTEGSHVAGTGPAAAGQARPGSRPASAAQALYPNLP